MLCNTLKYGPCFLRNESVSMKVFLLNMHEVRILFDLEKPAHNNFFSTKTSGLAYPEAVNVRKRQPSANTGRRCLLLQFDLSY